jgi:hypothetical protein
MELLDSITVYRRGRDPGRIELHKGDLTDLCPREAVDALVVAAFPDSYVPTPSTMIASLLRRGLSVEELAADKQADLRDSFSCWLSREVEHPPAAPSLRYKRLICFEPHWKDYWRHPPSAVEELYQGLSPFLGGSFALQTIAMPMLGAGLIGCTVAEMLPALVETPIRWMHTGFPLQCVRLAAYRETDAQTARKEFAAIKARFHRFDLFISYCHDDRAQVEAFLGVLAERDPGPTYFMDRNILAVGDRHWDEIGQSIRAAAFFVPFLSPSYLRSGSCMNEFSQAWMAQELTQRPYFFPILLRPTTLTPWMMQVNYSDCTAGHDALAVTARSLLRQLAGQA